MYSCRWFEHAYMHMFSGIDIHMLIYVNTDRIARACLPPSMYTCICSRALWYIYSYIQTCICSSRVEPYTHSCSHTYGHLCSHTHTNICTCIHTRTLVHTWVNAQMWDLVRKAMHSETRWNQKPLFGVTRRDHSPNSLSCKGFLRCFQRRLGPGGRAPVHSRHVGILSGRAHFICKYTGKVNTGLRKPSKLQGSLRPIVREPFFLLQQLWASMFTFIDFCDVYEDEEFFGRVR